MEKKDPNIFLYIPNILDYLRVVFVALAFFYSNTSPNIFFISYFISFCLDLFDGMAARHFNQTSKYGGTLDMVIDRISTSGLLMVLSGFYSADLHYHAEPNIAFFLIRDATSIYHGTSRP